MSVSRSICSVLCYEAKQLSKPAGMVVNGLPCRLAGTRHDGNTYKPFLEPEGIAKGLCNLHVSWPLYLLSSILQKKIGSLSLRTARPFGFLGRHSASLKLVFLTSTFCFQDLNHFKGDQLTDVTISLVFCYLFRHELTPGGVKAGRSLLSNALIKIETTKQKQTHMGVEHKSGTAQNQAFMWINYHSKRYDW